MQTIRINDVTIPEAAVLAEAQHHPAADAKAARAAAAEALAVRELLLQEARRQGIDPSPRTEGEGRRETEDDALIRRLLDANVTVPEADPETCRRYYDSNPQRFRSPDLYEAAHILFAAAADNEEAYERAASKAAAAIATLQDNPSAFDRLARELSDCSSAKDGGRLGQVSRGDTVPEFETFLCNLEESQLCPVPVRTRYGVHVLRLDRRIDGRQLPFEAVENRIADYLQTASWQRAVAQYIRILAGRADVSGITLEAAATPLVQ
ncbi:MAG TPA: peptidylprolyl isomerase [Kiloniellaceae bacterium]|nr:peptidylprolyl isomerase [Kiloniellaceae bacterium]HIP80237.1 peptidylprolyl isomerase [Kiloniellaceae bacterium]